MTLIALFRSSFRRLLNPAPSCSTPGVESSIISVIPAQAGIQVFKKLLDTGMRLYDTDIISKTALGLPLLILKRG